MGRQKPGKTKGGKGRPQPTRGPRGWVIPAGLGLLVLIAVYALTQGQALAPTDQPAESFTHVHGLTFDPHDPDFLYLATHYGLLRRGPDGLWVNPGGPRKDLMGFNISPWEEGVMYTSGHPEPGSRTPNPLGLMRSEDEGLSWEGISLVGEADFHALTLGAEPGSFYGWNVQQATGLYRSTDFGETWDHVDPEGLPEGPGDVYALAADPQRPNHLAAATPRGLYLSEDGGDTWTALLTGPTVTGVAFVPGRTDHLLAYIAHQEGGLVQSRDGGDSWARTGWILPENDGVIVLAIHPDNPDLIYAGTLTSSLYRSADGGRTWEIQADQGRFVEPKNVSP